ncbi:Kiwa anti-phage protein KwaB-like domain-containing protein [Burkholderia contaminans]|uniref:Kiwa anti-phage protein KwaB-like domain-containing protein n=1 Tax=Burkholderia contaminans TaxID=488447 RepID=UPI003D66A730
MDELTTFDFGHAAISLWIFKTTTAQSGELYRAWCLPITQAVEVQLRQLIADEVGSIRESIPFGPLVENGENQALMADVAGSSFEQLRTAVDQVQAEHEVANLRQLDNSLGYVLRFESGANIAYAVRRLSASWKPKKAVSIVSLIYSNGEFDLQENRSFELSRSVDFIVIGDSAYIKSKRNFESMLGYREHYVQAFDALKQTAEFTGIFSDIDFVSRYVGTNAVHLRRMCVIQEKGYFRDAGFMERLRQWNANQNWGIQFDGTGRIVPSEDSMRAILHCLLDQRLRSPLSDNTYDVPSAVPVPAAP